MKWLRNTWARLFWPRAAISAMERDVSRLVMQAAQTNTQLREIRKLLGEKAP